VNDVRISVDIDHPEGGRVSTLYSGFQNRSFNLTRGTHSLICQIDGLNLRPDRYPLNVHVGRGEQRVDFVQAAAFIEVEEVDHYRSGRLPDRAHGPMLTEFSWMRPADRIELRSSSASSLPVYHAREDSLP
jgi:hypothetical protein